MRPAPFCWSGPSLRPTWPLFPRRHLTLPRRTAEPRNPDTEHALGLLSDPDSLAGRAIPALGVTPKAAREALVAAQQPPAMEEPVSGKIPFMSRTKKVLELALREALLLGHNYIGTEHLLLGLLDDEESLGGGALTELGVTKERAREWLVPVLQQLTGERHQDPRGTPTAEG